jgi:hypothetical protein
MKGSDVVELLPEEFNPWRETAKEQRSFLRKSFKKNKSNLGTVPSYHLLRHGK